MPKIEEEIYLDGFTRYLGFFFINNNGNGNNGNDNYNNSDNTSEINNNTVIIMIMKTTGHIVCNVHPRFCLPFMQNV